MKIAISDPMEEFRRLVFKKKLFIFCTAATMAAVGQTEGTHSPFQILTFKRSWHYSEPETQPQAREVHSYNRVIMLPPIHVPDGFLFLMTEFLQRSRVHSLNFTLHFSTIYYDYSLDMLYVIAKVCILLKNCLRHQLLNNVTIRCQIILLIFKLCISFNICLLYHFKLRS